MDKKALVESDSEIERLILDALNRAKIPVTLFKRRYVPQLEEWQFVIATPWHDRKGPLTTYRAVIEAFQKFGVYEDIPMRRVFLRSPHDPVVAKLRESDQTDGFLHVLHHSSPKDDYSVIFAPITSTSGRVPAKQISTLDRLRKFLEDELGLRPSVIGDALAELTTKQSSSIFPVSLGEKNLRKVGHGGA